MNSEQEDLARKILAAKCVEVAPDLSADLLFQCYEIEKTYQFSADKIYRQAAIERIVDAAVSEISD